MKSKEDKLAKKIGLVVAWPLVGLLWLWYSHLWLPKPIGYFKCLVIALLVMLVGQWNKLGRWIFGILAVAAIIIQVLGWGGAIELPVFKLR